MIEITQLNIYPVKSLGRIELAEAQLGRRGFTYDRRWMVSDHEGNFVTQRDLPAMARVRLSLTGDSLCLNYQGQPQLEIRLEPPTGESVRARVWDDECRGYDEGDGAARWLQAALGKEGLRLLRFADEHGRPASYEADDIGKHSAAFADRYPFLVASEESLAELNRRLSAAQEQEVTMDRFRPNIVVRGVHAPFAEDSIACLRAPDGSFTLRLVKPCQRCKIITIDQQSGEQPNPKEPLRTLATVKHIAKPGAFFGQNAVLAKGQGALVRRGDKLEADTAGT